MPVISSGVPLSSSPFTIFSDRPGGVTKPEFDHSVAMSGIDQYTYFENQAKLQQERENNQIINYDENRAAKLSVALVFLAVVLIILEGYKTAMELFFAMVGTGYWGGLIYGVSGIIGYLSYRQQTYRLVFWTVCSSIIALIASLGMFGVAVGAFSIGVLIKPYLHVTMLIIALFGSICSFMLMECGRSIVFGKRTSPDSFSSPGGRY